MLLSNNYVGLDFSLTLTVIAVNGGFRKLVAPTFTFMDPFIGQPAEKSMMFRFDFRKPVHCLFDDNPCSKIAFNVTNDVTKVSFSCIMSIISLFD